MQRKGTFIEQIRERLRQRHQNPPDIELTRGGPATGGEESCSPQGDGDVYVNLAGLKMPSTRYTPHQATKTMDELDRPEHNYVNVGYLSGEHSNNNTVIDDNYEAHSQRIQEASDSDEDSELYQNNPIVEHQEMDYVNIEPLHDTNDPLDFYPTNIQVGPMVSSRYSVTRPTLVRQAFSGSQLGTKSSANISYAAEYSNAMQLGVDSDLDSSYNQTATNIDDEDCKEYINVDILRRQTKHKLS